MLWKWWQTLLRKVGVMATLCLRVCHNNTFVEHIDVYICKPLWIMYVFPDINQEKIVQEGGLDALLILLRTSQNTTLLRVASGAIANLAMNGIPKSPTSIYVCACLVNSLFFLHFLRFLILFVISDLTVLYVNIMHVASRLLSKRTKCFCGRNKSSLNNEQGRCCFTSTYII